MKLPSSSMSCRITGAYLSTGENLNSRKIPSTTSVDECINADAGVGASIASGNQTNSRNCAHFVAAAANSENIITVGVVISDMLYSRLLQSYMVCGIKVKMEPRASVVDIVYNSHAIINSQKSPKRFNAAVLVIACVVRILV